MNALNWVQLISSIILALATGVLAFITLKYMKATKRMVNSMEKQKNIMEEIFERNVDQIWKIHFERNSATAKKSKILSQIRIFRERSFIFE